MIDFVLDHILAHPWALITGLLVGALVPGVKLWLVQRARALERAAQSAKVGV